MNSAWSQAHFPFSIFDFSFVIEENQSMANIKWKMKVRLNSKPFGSSLCSEETTHG